MNPIVEILNLRTAEKQHGNVQHQSAAGNRALIAAYIIHENCLGKMPRTKDIVSAMNKSLPMVSKYLCQLSDGHVINSIWGGTPAGMRLGLDARSVYWITTGYQVPS